MVANLTLEEMVGLTGGVAASNGCSGNIGPIGRVGFPGMCMSDAGNGLRATDFVNSYPSGIHVAASWNRTLARARGESMGAEFRTKGVNVLLGPVVGPVGRTALGGRVWEGFSPDPYLAGALAGDTVRGVQAAGVIASTKHYVGNEQETNRNPTGADVAAVSSNIGDRAMHELYLWPFQDAVRAGTGSVMCSYNRVNNSYGCANSKTLNGLLKTELAFAGFVVSDWGAQHAGVAAALAGLDVAMPTAAGFFDDHLAEAVGNGSVPESRLGDMATRLLAAWYQMGQDGDDFPPPGIGMPASVLQPHDVIDARNRTALPVLYAGAVEGHVLVKNINRTLPLRSPRLLSIFGYSARAPDVTDPSDGGAYDSWTFGEEPIMVGGAVATDPSIGSGGTLFSGGGSGATAPSNAVSPFEALKIRAYRDGTAVFWDLTNPRPGVHPASDACIVLGNAWAREMYDRPGLRDDHTDGLILHVAGRCARTIVVLHNAGVRLVDTFIDHPNVTAVMLAHLPGQDSGPALAALLYGDENPSGRLPYAVPRNESDYGGGQLLLPALPDGIYARFPQANFSEGVLTDYRHFDAANISPRYSFGFGLSYTTFTYKDLAIDRTGRDADALFPTGPVVEGSGGPTDLWDVLVTVNATVTNTGDTDGQEVAQLYIGIPSQGDGGANSDDGRDVTPVRQLRGFDKRAIRAGDSVRVGFELTRRDLSVWDVAAQQWRLRRGIYAVSAGPDSGNLPLTGTFTI